ncbi:HCNGP-like protein-domain-containing protein [Hysterangium stoloniferum]|nr:HCNGP-like protein-domain-containing protein [Hysterangium stoloniferum]
MRPPLFPPPVKGSGSAFGNSVQVVRRPAQVEGHHDRAHSPAGVAGPSSLSHDTNTSPHPSASNPEDELTRIRACLRPPPIPGVEDWGIPPATAEPCDPELEASRLRFHLIRLGNPPKHFNDSLMSNRSFRNPHLYAKLVEFVDVDEKCSNMPKGCWDMDELDGWDAKKIATAQKACLKEQSAAQAPGKRDKIAFTSSSSSTGHGPSRTVPPAPSKRDVKGKRDTRKYDPYNGENRYKNPGTRW